MCSSADVISSPRCLDHFSKRRAALALRQPLLFPPSPFGESQRPNNGALRQPASKKSLEFGGSSSTLLAVEYAKKVNFRLVLHGRAPEANNGLR